jgi:hypothetical protein
LTFLERETSTAASKLRVIEFFRDFLSCESVLSGQFGDCARAVDWNSFSELIAGTDGNHDRGQQP